MKRDAVLTATLAAAALGISDDVVGSQQPTLTIAIPGDELHAGDLPANPSGEWWVVHNTGSEVMLDLRPITIGTYRTCGDDEPGQASGRTVSVRDVSNPIFLVRGLPGATAGPLRSAVVTVPGTEGEERVELTWDGRPAVVTHETLGPSGDQPGTHWVKLTIDGREFVLHEDQWHGDGHWLFRWMGDLNRDGWPDLLADASYKYSAYDTRLFLSRIEGREVTIEEVATFSHSSC